MDGEFILKNDVEWEHLGKLENPEYLRDDIVLAFKNPIYTPWNFRRVLEHVGTFPSNPLELDSREEAVEIVMDALNRGQVFLMKENPDYPLLRYQEYQKSPAEILEEKLKEEHPYKHKTGFPNVFGKKERLESPFPKREKKKPEGRWVTDPFVPFDLQYVLEDMKRTIHKPRPHYSRWKCFILIDYYARLREKEKRAAEAVNEPKESEQVERQQEKPAIEEDDRFEIYTFKVQVVDIETGEPVPEVKATITLPDGTEEKSVTDEDGWIVINELEDEGTSDVLIDLEENPLINRIVEESKLTELAVDREHVIEVEQFVIHFSI